MVSFMDTSHSAIDKNTSITDMEETNYMVNLVTGTAEELRNYFCQTRTISSDGFITKKIWI